MSDLENNPKLLQTSISYNSITTSKNRVIFKGLAGSTKYKGAYNSYSYDKMNKEEQEKTKKYDKISKDKSPTGVNKSKLKRKINAFFRLKQSKKFTAFYSISFPNKFPDESAITVLNNVLTTLRKNSLRFNYVWVAERQKNGTVHFHVLLNKFLNIRVTNFLFAKAIQNEIKVSELKNLNFNKYAYNGCDVKYVRNQGTLNSYMTKYVTKNNEKFSIRGWSSDQIVSSLFTSISYCAGEIELDRNLFYYNEKNEIVSFGDNFYTTFPLKHPPNHRLMLNLEYANDKIAENVESFKNELEKLPPVIREKIVTNELQANEQFELAF